MQTLIIEVSGGVVQEVYTDAENLRVVLVDWDAGESPGDASSGGDFATQPIGKLPEETMRAVLSLTA
jgi:hypothetical protein